MVLNRREVWPEREAECDSSIETQPKLFKRASFSVLKNFKSTQSNDFQYVEKLLNPLELRQNDVPMNLFMALFSLTYDLRKSRDYQSLYDELENFKAVRVLESVWCFNRFNTDAKQLRTYFKQFVDGDDGLFVTEVSDWGSFNAIETPNDLK